MPKVILHKRLRHNFIWPSWDIQSVDITYEEARHLVDKGLIEPTATAHVYTRKHLWWGQISWHDVQTALLNFREMKAEDG